MNTLGLNVVIAIVGISASPGFVAGIQQVGLSLFLQEVAKSKVPALGYGMPYAIGNTLLRIFGMVIVLLMTRGAKRKGPKPHRSRAPGRLPSRGGTG